MRPESRIIEPSAEYPLVLNGVPHAIELAELHVEIQSWIPNPKGVGPSIHHPMHARILAGLRIDVDEDSGADGAAQPDIQEIPLRQAFGRWPRLEELAGLEINVPDDVDWDAWYGNDAPPLENNRLRFGRWTDAGLTLRWTAEWDRGRKTRGTLVFEGLAIFRGIRLHLVEGFEPAQYVETIWGPGSLCAFDVEGDGWREITPGERSQNMTLWPRFLGPRPAAT